MNPLDLMTAIDYILPVLILLFVILAFTVAKDLGQDWKGIWRLLIAIAISGMSAVPLNFSIGTTLDLTSHNLAPIETLVWCGSFFFFALIIWWAKRIQRHVNGNQPDK
jgi:hypothetical protein